MRVVNFVLLNIQFIAPVLALLALGLKLSHTRTHRHATSPIREVQPRRTPEIARLNEKTGT